MSNFGYLSNNEQFSLFAQACIDAENAFAVSTSMCAVGCRKALELAVKWVYAADSSMHMPYRDNLQSLVHEATFKDSMDRTTWSRIQPVIRLGNVAVHTERRISSQDAMFSLRCLFDVVQWVDYCYGNTYEERTFDERAVPTHQVAMSSRTIEAIRRREDLVKEQKEQIKRLEQEVARLSVPYEDKKRENTSSRTFNPDEIPEYETRRRFIDIDLQYVGWDLEKNVGAEVEVQGMGGDPTERGFVDYVLYGKNGKPLAILEAKRTMLDANKGLQQARLYADCMLRRYGYRPFVFLSNGFDTYFVDDEQGPKRKVSGVFSQDDLQRLMNRRGMAKPLDSMRVDESISGRYYQIEAIRAVCENMDEGHRGSLLVMATGTGKTRTAAGLLDLLVRAGRVTNTLFLADRVALVRQAKTAFQEYLPSMSLCNLCEARDKAEASDARVVFSTYPTALNAIDEVRNATGSRLFTPAHFDLIVVDEAHRSVFRKYRAIFEYFDAHLVGLTATPKDEVARNTYEVFELERGVPTYVYEYETAVNKDHVLVPYHTIEVKTTFLTEGITYDDLSEEDKERYADDFEEQLGTKPPDFVDAKALNDFLFNKDTVSMVLRDLMDHGIKVRGGERVGKTIVFAQNRPHAEFILECLGKLYPKLPGDFAKRVVYTDDYSHSIIDEFKLKELPQLVISVDMMDTGVDVPEVVNLVFFKRVCSREKFWQMVGRGTRLRPGLYAQDSVDGCEYEDKRRFFIFDYCGNCEFFRLKKKGVEGAEPQSLSEKIYAREAEIAKGLQEPAYIDVEYQTLRNRIVADLANLAARLPRDQVQVKLRQREVERYSVLENLGFIGDLDLVDMQKKVAPLVRIEDADEGALRFDALLYGFMCVLLAGRSTSSYVGAVRGVASRLMRKTTIPQVKSKVPILQQVLTEDWLQKASVVTLDEVRRELRELYKFLDDDGKMRRVVTDVTDTVLSRTEGAPLAIDEDYTDYHAKVSRYVAEHADSLVIHKLRNNIPMTSVELDELGRILTVELGTAEDYRAAFGDVPFGLQMRRFTKLDPQAANEAFAEFINDATLNTSQIDFVKKVISYVETNGYMELDRLNEPPFNRPSFMRLFDRGAQQRLVAAIRRVRDNALAPAA